jgi:hypothetical protein
MWTPYSSSTSVGSIELNSGRAQTMAQPQNKSTSNPYMQDVVTKAAEGSASGMAY